MRLFIDDQTLVNAAKISATWTVVNATDVITSSAHGLTNGDLVTVTNSAGALPTGISAGVWYYVISATTNTFKLSATLGGSSIDMTSDGTGTQTFYREKVNMMDVASFDYVTVSLATSGTAAAVIRFGCSAVATMPDISAAQSTTNIWDHIGCADVDTYTSNIENGISGATGITYAGTDAARTLRFNVSGLKWFGLVTQTWSAGTLVIKARASSVA